MDRRHHERWVLAFDASCGTCRQISGVVGEACDGKLEVLPLADANVRQWREQSLGVDAEWAPTLLRVDGDRVRGWTGPAMVIPLIRRFGPATTMRVVLALGRLRRRVHGKASELPGAPTGLHSVSRAQFLRLAAGAGVAAGLVLTGKAPAFASQAEQTAQAWVNAHRHNLPGTYDEAIIYPEAHRRAIFQASSPAIRSQLWTEHIKRYREGRPSLTTQERDVLDRAAEFAAQESTFAMHQETLSQQAHEMYVSANSVFGIREAYRAFGVLGPVESSVNTLAYAQDCECAYQHDYCRDRGLRCQNGSNPCNYTDSGCGWMWSEQCAGFCL